MIKKLFWMIVFLFLLNLVFALNSVKITGYHSGGPLSGSFNIDDYPPVIDAVDKFIDDAGVLVEINVSAYDPNGETVTITFVSPLNSSGQWQSTINDSGIHTTNISVFDGSLTTIHYLTIKLRPYCGDGNVSEGEECDDSNNIDGDGCSSECLIEQAPSGGGGSRRTTAPPVVMPKEVVEEILPEEIPPESITEQPTEVSEPSVEEQVREPILVVPAVEIPRIAKHVKLKVSKESDFSDFSMYEDDKIHFSHKTDSHIVEIAEVGDDYIVVIITSDPIILRLTPGEVREVDLDSDGVFDLTVSCSAITRKADEIIVDLALEIISDDIILEDFVYEPYEGNDFVIIFILVWLLLIAIFFFSRKSDKKKRVVKKKKRRSKKSKNYVFSNKDYVLNDRSYIFLFLILLTILASMWIFKPSITGYLILGDSSLSASNFDFGGGTIIEDFESFNNNQDLDESSNWSANLDWKAASTAPYDGSLHGEAKNLAGVEKHADLLVNASGYVDVQLSFYGKTGAFEEGDHLKVSWFDGSQYNVLASGLQPLDWTSYNYDLPSSADSLDNLKIRFTCLNDHANEYCHIDNVQLSASPDITPPSPVSNLNLLNKDVDFIYWVWSNPSDSDFSYTEIYINKVNILNTSDTQYYAIDLDEATNYTISLKTVDICGNINPSAVSDSQFTDSSCFETWVQINNSCLQNNSVLISYFDSANCNTTLSLPSNNGTFISCDYIVSDEFLGTDLLSINLSNIVDLNLTISDSGSIIFSDSISLNQSLDFDSNIEITDNSVTINSANLPELNKSAVITFFNLSLNDPIILKDGFECSNDTCSLISYDNITFVFSVSHFTTYSIVENPFCGDGLCNGVESCSSCSADCGSCPIPSSGGGGGGSSKPRVLPLCDDKLDNDNDGFVDLFDPGCNNSLDNDESDDNCFEDWVCDEWSKCINGYEKRVCVDDNDCGTLLLRPETALPCDSVDKSFQETVPVIPQPIVSDSSHITGKTIEVLPDQAPDVRYVVPTVLLLFLLIAIFALRKTHLNKKMKKILVVLHFTLIFVVVILLLASLLDSSITGLVTSDHINFSKVSDSILNSPVNMIVTLAVVIVIIASIYSFVVKLTIKKKGKKVIKKKSILVKRNISPKRRLKK